MSEKSSPVLGGHGRGACHGKGLRRHTSSEGRKPRPQAFAIAVVHRSINVAFVHLIE